MRKVFAIAGSALFLAIAPGFVAGVVPYWISRWRIEPPFLGVVLLRYVGVTLVALGSIGLLDSFLRFAVQGLGTPAPVFPTRHLVVSGLYRYVRNPMYTGVLAVGLSLGLALGTWVTPIAAGLVFMLQALRTRTEEKYLIDRFGDQYRDYMKRVGRFLPRLPARRER